MAADCIRFDTIHDASIKLQRTSMDRAEARAARPIETHACEKNASEKTVAVSAR
jgi:hypothetical protein